MEAIVAFFSSYFSYWPLVCFCVLLLAGFNLPISEDVLIVMSALIAYEDNSLLIPNYIALYCGIFLSDIICFWLGGLLGKGVVKFKLITKALTPEKMEYLAKKLDKHGFLTFIVVRFIPFGMRNVLFLTAGFTKLPTYKFLIFDSIAALISSLSLYSLVLYIGKSAHDGFKVVGIVLFVLVWGLFIAYIVKKILDSKRKQKNLAETQVLGEEKGAETPNKTQETFESCVLPKNSTDLIGEDLNTYEETAE